uniref:Uncharacterized protein n=2 Tax=Aegilops tauschii subsp. strangulata TaxID=200361 RepID=A0A453M6G0_AEGTS
YRACTQHGDVAFGRSSLNSSTEKNVFVVDNYGARGTGSMMTRRRWPRAKAWNAACSSSRPAVLLVPRGRSYLLMSITFLGPCKYSVTFMVKGTLVAPRSRSAWNENNMRHWIVIEHVTNH